MDKQDRRNFLKKSAAVVAMGLGPRSVEPASAEKVMPHGAGELLAAQKAFGNEGKKPLRLGLIIGIGKDPDAAIAKVHELGLPTCQAYVEEFEEGLAGKLTKALAKYETEATTVAVGGPGTAIWAVYGGPAAISEVGDEKRAGRGGQNEEAPRF